MEKFPFNELADMHLIYGEAKCNGREASRLYKDRYPHRRHPDHKTFASIHRRLAENGNFRRGDGAGRPRTARTPSFEEEVLDQVEQEPSTSIRKIAHCTRASKTTVGRVLQNHQLHPYSVQRVQAMGPEDYLPRMEFCRWFLDRLLVQHDFGRYVLFTDEACFNRDGFFNIRNSHLWDNENPHGIALQKNQNQFAVNIWAGIVGDKLIGPYLLPPRLNGHIYLQFLKHVLPELLQDVPFHIKRAMWIQHDGAPAHYTLDVRQYLNQKFPNRWIGRGGPVAWPARSPDLNPLDFFLWGYVKSLVYDTPIVTQEDLLARVMAACTHVQHIPGIFSRVRASMNRRCKLCIEVNGHHFEQLL